jgi:hypothetical protein
MALKITYTRVRMVHTHGFALVTSSKTHVEKHSIPYYKSYDILFLILINIPHNL